MIIVLDSLDAADQVLGPKHIWANNGRYYVFTEQDMPKFDESIGGWVKILDHLGAPIDYSLPAAVAGNESEPITFLLSSLAGSVIQDFSGYLSASITISQFPTRAILTVYASQDSLTNWVPAPIEAVGALSGNGMLSQISTSGAWVVPRRSRYFKIEATGFVSGDVIGQYTLSSVPLAPRAIVAHGAVSEGATKSGYPVPVGGTVRTSDTARLAGQRAEAQFSPESNLLVQIAPGASSGALPLLAIVTGQRRGDLLKMRHSDIHSGHLHIKQQKTGTKLALPSGLRLDCIGTSLQDVVTACVRYGAPSDLLLHKSNGAPLCPASLSYRFEAVREAALPPWTGRRAPPSLHECRALAARLYQEQGNIDVVRLPGHSDYKMTKVYLSMRGLETNEYKMLRI